MDIRELKNYIYDNGYAEQILKSIGCHHIKYHTGNNYWSCGNKDGDNQSAIILYNTDYLPVTNYTRQLNTGTRKSDIIDLVCFAEGLSLFEGIKFICNEIGISYYHDFESEMPECFKLLKIIEEMGSVLQEEKDKPLVPISECILSYYKPFVNDLFAQDNIDYSTQRDFEIGYDEESNRYTIPIRSELGDLVGVKGRYFNREVPERQNKYVYLEPCSKSRILYGLNKTLGYIKRAKRVFVCESEKAVMQLWSYGYKNSVSTGGKTLSQYQIDMLTRLGVQIVFCFDKDVGKEEIESIAERFPDGIDIYYMFDEDNLLSGHESPSDCPKKWKHLVTNNIYKIK